MLAPRFRAGSMRPHSCLASMLLVLAVLPASAQDSLAAGCPEIGCPRRQAAKTVVVTPEHLATAFRDPQAPAMLRRARAVRLQQDSTLLSYEAMAYLRLSIGASVGRVVRDRVLFRMENAARVRWHRGVGVRLDVVGLRATYPGRSADAASQEMARNVPEMMLMPWYPGQETLLIGWGSADPEVDEAEIVHPLAEGAEAYYTYATGEVAEIRLSDGGVVRLRELKVRPRVVAWNVIVGSLWLDVDRGQIVRAAYRPAEPLDIWARIAADPSNDPGLPSPIRRLLSPLRAQVSEIGLEYGLHDGRFWLPRVQSIEGHAQAAFMRVPFRSEQAFRYTAVNAPTRDSMPPAQPPVSSLSATRQPAGTKPIAPCDTGSVHTIIETRTPARMPVIENIPCDHVALARSPDLPGLAEEDLFDREALGGIIRGAIGLDAQPEWSPRPPVVEHGPHLLRFNRIEGLSLGIRATSQLGAGYVADGTIRLGAADREPNLELGLARTNLVRTIRIGAHSRLVASNDWGNPLGFGSSLSALLWARDDGFYYRTTGIDITGIRDTGSRLAWRIFAEQQRTAVAENSFSLAKLTRDAEFQPNIIADHGVWAGVSLRTVHTLGLDPRGWRTLGDARLEAAAGETAYGRAAAEFTVSRALGPVAGAAPLAALALSAGSSTGAMPAQRLWYIGGVHTVRGHPAGAAAGDAYWFGQFELAKDLLRLGRLSLFGDAGWAGARADLAERATFRLRPTDGATRTLSGAGVGVSLLDGLIRLDVARGIHPRRGWRTDLRLEARF